MSLSLLDAPVDRPTVDADGPAGATALAAALSWIDRGIDALTTQMGLLDPAAAAPAVERRMRRLAAAKLALIAKADEEQVAARTGMSNTSAWLAKQTNADGPEAARKVKLAQALRANPAASRPSSDPGFVAHSQRPVERANNAGDLTEEQAQVIVKAIDQLPAGVNAEQVLAAETDLVSKAQKYSANQLRRIARRAMAAYEPDEAVVDAHEDGLLADEESRAYERVRLTLHDNNDGTVSGHFTLPTMQGQLLEKILQTMTAPRRAKFAASRAQSGHAPGRTDWAKLHGEAFCELIEHLPTDRLNSTTAATVLVTIDEDTLRERLKAAQLDTGSDLSSGQARRLACNAGILPAVLNGESLPLDQGRKKRLFTEAQRTALALRHTTCAAAGCDRPYSWCELHHRVPWSAGGTTNLDDAVPLCWFHHRRIHDRRYLHRYGPDGITFHEHR